METKNTHGGDVITAQSEYGSGILDFSVNINPYGIPKSVKDAAAGADYTRYPDPLCRELAAGIAEKDGVSPEQVLCGNGAADIIYRLAFALKPKTALLTAPTFSEYEEALRASGCDLSYYKLKDTDNFDLTESFLDALEPGIDVAFLCNPNNPTGRMIDSELLLRTIEKCAELKIRLVVDECFLGMTDAWEHGGLAPYISDFKNLLLLRAFTKTMAMPGLRLGYCLTSDAKLLNAVVSCGQAWSVSEPAQAAGIAALKESEHVAKARALLAVERPRQVSRLRDLGLKVYVPAANYILFRAEGINNLKERMLGRGILIRSCANYVNLGKDYYRVAILTPEENYTLIQNLTQALAVN